MVYGLLADAVVVVHGLYILFVVLGALLALRWRRVLWVHAPAALWGAWVELGGRICPLTPLENRLRRMGGASGYEGGFIETYLLPVIYPGGLTREVQIALGALVLVLNAGLYAWLLRRRIVPSGPGRAQGAPRGTGVRPPSGSGEAGSGSHRA